MKIDSSDVIRDGRHLDLGCGTKPRNPYRRRELMGVDISPFLKPGEVEIRCANLAIDKIPFPDNHFDSVSAYDFLEHIPRVMPTADGRATRFPFIELMDEIWRVLTPNGSFYAQTPAFPHPTAFQDPTHVNIITDQSHTYFCRPELMARGYGYKGDFETIRVVRIIPEFEYEPIDPDWHRRRRLRRRRRRGDASHLIWELRAKK